MGIDFGEHRAFKSKQKSSDLRSPLAEKICFGSPLTICEHQIKTRKLVVHSTVAVPRCGSPFSSRNDEAGVDESNVQMFVELSTTGSRTTSVAVTSSKKHWQGMRNSLRLVCPHNWPRVSSQITLSGDEPPWKNLIPWHVGLLSWTHPK